MITAEQLRTGDRRVLARAITLVESTRAGDNDAAILLLDSLADTNRQTWRIGISGAPGVGKSTFIESFGCFALAQGRKVAVLAVDPSSRISGGSILGDKTRMARLARAPGAFVRPSPAGDVHGGVASRTRDVIRVVEAAGYDCILVETVGIGQSEAAVANMTDFFLLLLAPGAGDSLQGVKRGVMELADLVLINKNDGAFVDVVRRMCADYKSALSLMQPRHRFWKSHVQTCSAREETGLEDVWNLVQQWFNAAANDVSALRSAQSEMALREEVVTQLLARVVNTRELDCLMTQFNSAVEARSISVRNAARQIITSVTDGKEDVLRHPTGARRPPADG